MQDVLLFVLKNLVTVPDDVKIEEEDVEGTTNYIVTVNPADVGRIIGKEGKVIKAIRTIMRVIAIQRGLHVRVSVVSENDPRNPPGSGEVKDEAGDDDVIVTGTPPTVPESDTLAVEV